MDSSALRVELRSVTALCSYLPRDVKSSLITFVVVGRVRVVVRGENFRTSLRSLLIVHHYVHCPDCPRTARTRPPPLHQRFRRITRELNPHDHNIGLRSSWEELRTKGIFIHDGYNSLKKHFNYRAYSLLLN